ncbi:MAG: serine acetyltransferase [Oscillospiraceae bacterium]|nr:serine acetyltransferase [Oscillospiraceae bacterium]
MNTIEAQIQGIVDGILLDYQNGRDIDKIDLFRHPDKAVITDMIRKLIRIVYPGYYRDKSYRHYNIEHHLSMLIEDVMFNLNRQLILVYQAGGMDSAEAEEKAQQVSLEFFKAIPAVRVMVQTDVQAAYDGDPAASSKDEVIFCYPGLFAITVYRLAHILYELKVPMVPRIMTEHAHSTTGIDIHPGATIGKHFFIDHGTGIVIGETTIIGEHVKIYQGVTLGGLTTRGGQSLKGCKRHPTIEDNVTIYAGASVLGGETVIGRDSVIGANSFITKSIAPCTTVSIKNQELQFKSRSCAGCANAVKEPFWENQKTAE